MTQKRKLEILWELLTVAVGLDTLMTREEIMNEIENPWGLCEITSLPLKSLAIKEPHFHGLWWWECGDWNIRSKALLKAIKKVSKEIKQ